MKYYGMAGTCSLAPHVALREAGLPFDYVKVDIFAKKYGSGEDFRSVNPKGYVPALLTDDGQLLTENPILQTWIADRVPDRKLAPAAGTMDRYRFQETLNFICSELHKGVFNPMFNPKATDEWKEMLRGNLAARLAILEAQLKGKQYLIGDGYTLADSYLFTILRWTGHFKIDLSPWPNIQAHFARIGERPVVKAAQAAEAAAT
jgi:glutathione S-transferase